jgi:hypothetical protein
MIYECTFKGQETSADAPAYRKTRIFNSKLQYDAHELILGSKLKK